MPDEIGGRPVPARACQSRVLIVEDDSSTRETFAQILGAAGHAVSTAVSLEDALSLAFAENPSAILLDIHLQDADGLETLRRLRRSPRHVAVPVAVLTGDYMLDGDVVRELRELGARVYFKPVWEEDLHGIVATLLGDDHT